jgi:magnesium transporter
MIRLVATRSDGALTKRFQTLPSSEEWSALEPSKWVSAWIDLEDPNPESLAWLERTFQFHPLALEDCSHANQRPKLEEYPGHLFLVLHGLCPCPKDGFRIFEFHAFLTAQVVVSVHDGDLPQIELLMDRWALSPAQMPKGRDFVLFRVLDSVLAATPQALDELESRVERLEDEIASSSNQVGYETLHDLQRQLTVARKHLAPGYGVLSLLVNQKIEGISKQATLYFRNLQDHIQRNVEACDFMRDMLISARDAFTARSNERTNEAMKRLTAFSVIFLPLTFITGFFGMNFESMPWKSSWALMFTIGSVAVLPLTMMIWFRTKRWL